MNLHILGICGTFMGGIAAIARDSAKTSPAATRTSTRR
jgi:UDP-N-acetylmuramate-alanine ligase